MTTVVTSTPDDGERRDNSSQRNDLGTNTPYADQAIPEQRLSDHALPEREVDPQQVELERRVHGVLRRMTEYLNIEVSEESFPRVIFKCGDPVLNPASYDPQLDHIEINRALAEDGYIFGEEIAHWLHSWCLRHSVTDGFKLSDSPDFEEQERYNAIEFVGYLGREIARIACRNTEYEHLFTSEEHAPRDPEEINQIMSEQYRGLKKLMRQVNQLKTEPRISGKLRTAANNLNNFVIHGYDYSDPIVWVNELERHLIHFTELVNGDGLVQRSGDNHRETIEGHQSSLQQLHNELHEVLAGLRTAASIADETTTVNYLDQLEQACKKVVHLINDINEDPCPGIALAKVPLLVAIRSNLNHSYGYIAAALWLNQNCEDLTQARELFFKAPPDLWANYVEKLLWGNSNSSSEKPLEAI